MLPTELKKAYPQISHFIERALMAGKLGHAFICTGQSYTAKEIFVRELTMLLNCKNKTATQSACGECLNCKWIKSDQHPTALTKIEPDLSKSKKGIITIEQVRSLQAMLTRKAQGIERSVIISPAEENSLPSASANALLKTIEEPNPGIIFFLFASDPSQVLPTIESRCQLLHFVSVPKSSALRLDPELEDSLFSGELNWYECTKLYEKITETNLQDLIQSLRHHCQGKFEGSFRDGFEVSWLYKLKHLDESEKRLKQFCTLRHVMEELFWRLSHD
ncbi:MAG: hypothetical protein SFT81_02805 [Candidatus Caenarcaniphilales bacterium]|nr:hypothetical protein [Candidatus Caenarcaniphilales bacterium]